MPDKPTPAAQTEAPKAAAPATAPQAPADPQEPPKEAAKEPVKDPAQEPVKEPTPTATPEAHDTAAAAPQEPAIADAAAPRWFKVTTPTQIGAVNVLAADVDSAKERFKKAMGIRNTPHDIKVTEQAADFRPSAQDEEFERMIDLNDSPRR